MADPAELIMHHGLAVANYERSPTKENGTILHATEKALLAALAKTAPEGWRDISAAPKDRYVWIWDGEVRVLARWHQAIKAWIGTDERGIAYDSRRYNAPTPVLAWQNLPAAPKVPT